MYHCKYCNSSFTTHNHKVMHENECPYKGAKPGHKFCRICKKETKLKNFNISKARYDNLNGQCKECTKAYYKKWSTDIVSDTPIRKY